MRRSFALIGRVGGHHNIDRGPRNESRGIDSAPQRRCLLRRVQRLIIPHVARRIHIAYVRAGETVSLDRAEAHHARDVLRLADGTPVEVFDDEGALGHGVLVLAEGDTAVRVERVQPAGLSSNTTRLCVAAAVPKGDRADWMVEKLSELGVEEFVPVAATRSVVLPEGKGKRDRWVRIATEAAKQSRRAGVMRIAELTSLPVALRRTTDGATATDGRPEAAQRRVWFLSTESEEPTPIGRAVADLPAGAAVTAFVGPEGGWTAAELEQFIAAGATAVRLTPTILRIETAAVTAAAVIACLRASGAAGGAPDPLDARRGHDDHPGQTTGERA